MRRRIGIGLAALAVALVALALLIHAPFVRRAVLRYATSTLESQYGIRLEAERLDYNLSTLRIGLAGVRVSAAGRTPPFFEAEYVAVTIPRQTLFGDLAIDDLSVRGGTVRLVRAATGGFNLPESRQPSTEEPAPLRIGRIAVLPLRVEVRDDQIGFAFDAPAVELELTEDDGRIAFTQPATLSVGGRTTRLTRVAGGARFDGRALQLVGLEVDAGEGRVRTDGSVTMISREPSMDLRITGTGDLARLAEWGLDPADVPRGTVAFAGRVTGPFAALAAEVDMTSGEILWQQTAFANVSTHARATQDALNVDRFDADIRGGHVTGTLDVPFGDDDPRPLLNRVRADAGITLGNTPPPFVPIALPGEAELSIENGAWRYDGRHRVGGVAAATASLFGRLSAADIMRSTVMGRVRVADSDLGALLGALRRSGIADIPAGVAPEGVVRADASVTGTLARATVTYDVASDSLHMATPDITGPAAVMGTFDTATQRYTFDAVYAGRMTPTGDMPLAGDAEATLMGSGRGAMVTADGEVAARDVTWDGTALGDVTATVKLDGQRAQILAAVPKFPANVDATIELAAPHAATLDVRAVNVDLAPLVAGLDAPVPLAGATTVHARASGALDDWRRGQARVEVEALDASAGGLPIRLREPAVVRYEDGRVLLDRLEADAGETRISAFGSIAAFSEPGTRNPEPGTGNLDSGIVAAVSGDVGEVARAVAATGLTELPIEGGDGPVALLARVTGSLERPDLSADLEVGPGTIALKDLPAVSDLRLRTHVEGGWLELREAQGSYQGAAIAGTGRMPLSLLGVAGTGVQDGEATLRARATGITAAVLEPFIDPGAVQELSGSIDATIAVDSPSLDLNAVRGELQLDRLDLRIADLPVTQRVPTRIVARDGFARVEAWDWTGEGATLNVAGQVRLMDRQSAILANGEVDLRMLTPFVRAAGLTTAGTLRPRLSVTGDLANPRIDGDLQLAGGEMRVADPRIILSDLNGRAVLTRSTASLTSLTGGINGGTLTAEGGAEFRPDAQLDATLTTSIRDMAMDFPAGLRTELNADLQLEVASGAGQPMPGGRLDGVVTVLRGSYREPMAVVTGLLANLRAANAAALALANEPSVLDSLTLDVRVVTDEDIIVDNNYGRFQLGADINVIGSASAPALSGRAELREGGQLFVGRNTYTITSGTINFANPVVVEPNFNIVLGTRAGGEEIELTLTGTPDAPGVAMTSESGLGQADITAILLTGRRLDELADTEAAIIGAQLLGNLSADVLGFAGRAIGLDTLRLGTLPYTGSADPAVLTTELDPTSRLTFGKAIGSDVDVTFSQSLRDGDAQTWIIEYLPSRRIQLRLVSDDDDLRTYGFRHDVSFGGPTRATTALQPRPRDEARIAAVVFAGTLVLPEDRLRALLSLEEGDRFDFVDWQRDRDRIVELYQGEGYLTARITAARSDAPDVTLTYTIVPGSRGEIVVRGIDASEALLAELRDAWIGAVFDTFLTDEAAGIVRRRLAAERYLQPRVDASVSRAGDVATLLVDVDRGAQTTEIVADIGGAGEPLAGELTAFVDGNGMAERAIADPATVEREMTGYLHAAGRPRGRATVGAPRFEGQRAIVPITVDAGDALVFGATAFEGAGRLTVDQLRAAAAIPEGAPADPAIVEAARGRVVALYRSEGFATAVVAARETVRRGEPRLDVTFAVTEGPRQMLADVAIAGNRGIDTDVIERALRLEKDQPVRPGDWLQARTRVFDTGLFRRVDVSPELLREGATADAIPVRMQVTVEEWPALRARYGFQVAEERPEDSVNGRDLRPGLSGDITRRTLFGRAVTVGAAAGVQQRERLGRLFLNAPTLASLPVRSSLIFEAARREFAAATLVTATKSVAWEQRLRLSPRLNLSYVYRFERNHTYDTEPPPGDFPFDIRIDVARITGSAAWDTRDDPADTTRGMLASTSLEFSAERLGSDFAYIRSLSQAYYFRPVKQIVLASAARYGIVEPREGQELIPSLRFFAGGSRTVRGVDEDSLGETDFFGDPAGGKVLLVLNQEARFPIYRWLRGVGFLDVGNVFAEPPVKWGDLTTSAGVGVRLWTPFGILRADFARTLTSGPEGSGRVTVGIGQAF